MPEFAVPTVFTAIDKLSPFWSKQSAAASKWESLVRGTFQRAGHEAGMFGKILGGVTLGNLAANAIQNAPRKILDVMKSISGAAGEVEKYKATLVTMLGSQDAANARFQEMSKFAAVTPFELNQVVDLGNKLQSIGLYSTKMMTTVGDLAAASGKPVEQAANALAKLASGQKGEAVNMFRDLLISTQDWQKAIGKGISKNGELKASAEQMIAALPKILAAKGFAGMMDQQAKTMGGIMSNMSDSITRLKAAAGGPLNDALKKLIPPIQGIVEKATAWVDANHDLIATRIDQFIDNVGKFLREAKPYFEFTIWALKNFGPPILAAAVAFNVMKGALIASTVAMNAFAIISTAMEAYALYAGGAATAQEALNLVMAANPVGLVVAGIAALIAIIVLLVKHWDDVTAAARSAWEWMQKVTGLSNEKQTQVNQNAMATPAAGGFQSQYNLANLSGIQDPNAPTAASLDTRIAPKREAPNAARAAKSEWSGRLDIAGAPAGSKLTQSGSAPIRAELLGANP